MTHTAPNPISEEICKSFDPKFIEMLGEPTGEQHKAFCKLVEATQEKGLDWWHINLPEKKLAFCGRKNPKASKASASLLVYNAKTKNIKTPRGSSKLFGSLGNLTKKPLEEQIGHLLTELETGFLKSDPILKPRDHGEKYLPNKLPYEDVDPALVDEEMADEEDLFEDPILERFCEDKPDFRPMMKSWGEPLQKAFSRLASAVHNAGLDWWHIDPTKNHQIRFGRKDIGSIRAKKTIAYIEAKQLTIRSAKSGKLEVGSFGAIPLQEFDIKFMERLSDFFEMNAENSPIASRANRKAYWPDEIGIHQKDDGRDEDENDEDESKERASTVQTPMNRIYYGPPGTGKTHRLNPILEETYGKPKQGEPELEDKDQKKRYAFVTFHQSYGYEEFVEGLRPVLDEASAEGGQVRYEIRAGVFKALCEKARDAKKEAKAKGTPDAEIPRYAMVIDEINRGNISKIFGELITLIEDDKREGMPNAVSVTLPYSGKPFSVPANVDIIGTMNTADRSLALLDTALRRRFEFVPMLPDTRYEEGAPLHKLEVEGIDIRLMLETMNKRIEVVYDRDHCIGHAYFTKLNKKEDEKPATLGELGSIFKNKIIPLLEEYFFEDWNKIRLVLGDKSKTDDAQFIHETKMDSTELTDILGPNHGLESDNLAPRYKINPDAFENISAYTGIYNTPNEKESPNSTESSSA